MAVLIYPVAQLEAVAEAVQPIAGYEGVGPCFLGTPVESEDGRYAHVHPWSEAECDFLAARVSGIGGAVVLELLPEDWRSKQVEA